MVTYHKSTLLPKLIEGRNTANQLQNLLQNPLDHGSVSAEELAMKIMSTFTESLSVLTDDVGHDDHHSAASGEVYQINSEPSHVEHSHCDDRSSEDSGESRKRLAFKDRRGCYKRRKTCESWTLVSATIEDGQAWRKYGQKDILNAQYPRAYFRCTRKFDQGCRATKQVQQVQDNPRMYQTTYVGNHTCRNMIKPPPMIIGSDLFESHSESGTPNNQLHDIFGSSSSIPNIVKQEEYKEGTPTPSDLTDNISSLETNNDNDMWSDFKDDFGLPEPAAYCVSSKMVGSENDDVASNIYLDMDFVVKNIDFESVLDFNDAEFPINSL